VRDARTYGWPVMRHLYLDYPQDPNTWTLSDEYMYGASLLVAPIVARGATSRSVYLPEASYFDYWTGQRVTGGGNVTAQATLDQVPVYARIGAIIPMLSPYAETVVTPTNGGVISASATADFLQVDVFAGGQTTIQLDDGTILSQTSPVDPFDPGSPTHAAGAIPSVAYEVDLTACDGACTWTDPSDGTLSVAVVTQSDTIQAGPLTLSVSGAPPNKRFVFRVRH
jgi:hypothetical protein